jgi:hypothetical protein
VVGTEVSRPAVRFARIRTTTVGLLPLGTRKDEPGGSSPKAGRQLLEHVPIDMMRSIKATAEHFLFVPLDRVGWRIGTKMIVWAHKGD